MIGLLSSLLVPECKRTHTCKVLNFKQSLLQPFWSSFSTHPKWMRFKGDGGRSHRRLQEASSRAYPQRQAGEGVVPSQTQNMLSLVVTKSFKLSSSWTHQGFHVVLLPRTHTNKQMQTGAHTHQHTETHHSTVHKQSLLAAVWWSVQAKAGGILGTFEVLPSSGWCDGTLILCRAQRKSVFYRWSDFGLLLLHRYARKKMSTLLRSRVLGWKDLIPAFTSRKIRPFGSWLLKPVPIRLLVALHVALGCR